MQLITISGNLGRDAEMRTAGDNEVCSFSVGVKQGYGDRASSNWFRCNLWGKRGQTLAPYLTKGTKVVVVGELTIGEYQGKPSYDIRVSEVELLSKGERQSAPANNRGSAASAQPDYGAALDDDVPFISCDFALEPSIRRKQVI